MWRWLVIAAIIALWLEWALYYMARERQRVAEVHEGPVDQPKQEFDGDLEIGEAPASRKTNLVGR
jgi:type VI protein secretion system component VasK